MISALAWRRWRTHLAGVLLLGCGYIALDWASYINPLGSFNITPWNPPPALAIVWIMLGGLWYAPVVLVASIAGDVLIRGTPGGIWVTGLTSLVQAVGYAAIAWILMRSFGDDVRLRNSRQIWILAAVTAIGAAGVALAYVGILYLAGYVPVGELVGAVIRFWLGDLVGVMVTAPLMLVAIDSEARDRLLGSWKKSETLVQFGALATITYLVLESLNSPTRYFYLLFLPMIWVAIRGGLPGAALASALVQIGVVVWTRGDVELLSVVELQARMAALTLTGLFLGIMVDERQRAGERLRRSLKLAAAGETAGAIAHELNQPLAALANYASAAISLEARDAASGPRGDLQAVLEKMRGEALRAGAIVGRLRDFYRSGTLRFEETRIDTLIEVIRRIGREIDPSGSVQLLVSSTANVDALVVDPLQIEIVLRNLLSNAHEAVSQAVVGKPMISVTLSSTGDKFLFAVVDNGPGVAPSLRDSLFDPFASGKSTGMGFGLAISQSIVEAHGGSLVAMMSNHGEFHMTLPIEEKDDQ